MKHEPSCRTRGQVLQILGFDTAHLYGTVVYAVISLITVRGHSKKQKTVTHYSTHQSKFYFLRDMFLTICVTI